jgi:hypothetical protein
MQSDPKKRPSAAQAVREIQGILSSLPAEQHGSASGSVAAGVMSERKSQELVEQEGTMLSAGIAVPGTYITPGSIGAQEQALAGAGRQISLPRAQLDLHGSR